MENPLNGKESDIMFFPSQLTSPSVTMEELKEMKFSGRKAEYLLGVAALFREGKLSREQLTRGETVEAIRKSLVEIRGIGPWTANYVLLKSLGRVDCIPHGDSGLNAAVKKLLAVSAMDHPKVAELYTHFEGWGGYLTIYLWRSLMKEEN